MYEEAHSFPKFFWRLYEQKCLKTAERGPLTRVHNYEISLSLVYFQLIIIITQVPTGRRQDKYIMAEPHREKLQMAVKNE